MDNINHGPLDNSVLFDQQNHISEDVWEDNDRGVLESIVQNISITYDKWESTPAQILLLNKYGFGVFTNHPIVTKTYA